jgi:hypothetical protein
LALFATPQFGASCRPPNETVAARVSYSTSSVDLRGKNMKKLGTTWCNCSLRPALVQHLRLLAPRMIVMAPLNGGPQQIGLSITQRVVGRAAALLVTLETNLGQEIAEIIPPNISKDNIIIYIIIYIPIIGFKISYDRF